jgi:hypothetical protein
MICLAMPEVFVHVRGLLLFTFFARAVCCLNPINSTNLYFNPDYS